MTYPMYAGNTLAPAPPPTDAAFHSAPTGSWPIPTTAPAQPPQPPAKRSGLRKPLSILLIVPTLAAVPPRYSEVDESADTAAQSWLDATLPALAQNAVVISWWSYSTPLWYAQFVNGQRPDVFVVDDRTMIDQQLGTADDVIARYLGQRPVYLIRLPQDLATLRLHYVLTPVSLGGGWPDGTLYRVDGVVL